MTPKNVAAAGERNGQVLVGLRSEVDDVLRAKLRKELDEILRLLIDRALVVDCEHEANILLDALVLLNRDTDDLDGPITAEERLAVVPHESANGEST